MQKYHEILNQREIPQSEPLPGQVPNSAGGFAYAVDCWKRLERFLILGSVGGTYYVKPRALTKECAVAVKECLGADWRRTVDLIVDVSDKGRAPQNDPALYALALASAHPDLDCRRYAFEALPKVARIGTHLFHFLSFMQSCRGWGRAAKRGVAEWYVNRDVYQLAYQVVKYRQRDGWTHRDALRLAKPKEVTGDVAAVFDWICGRAHATGAADRLPPLIAAFEELPNAADPAALIEAHRLPREAVPSELLSRADVWEALLESMPQVALVRNLSKLSAVGVLKPLGAKRVEVIEKLTDPERIAKSRIHPVQILLAMRAYQKGKGRHLEWAVDGDVVAALDAAFYQAFANVEPTGKRYLLGVDVSASMEWPGSEVNGVTSREAATVMAMLTVKAEKNVHAMAFSTSFMPLPLNKSMSLNEAANASKKLPHGGTDCALPMTYALEQGLEVDVFVVYTDSETWAGGIHPIQALQKYRDRTGIAAKLCVMAFASNGFSIADPDDAGMLDVVGFDASVPQVLTEFAG